MALLLLASGQTCAGIAGELVEIQAQTIPTEAKIRLATAQWQLEGKGEIGQVVSVQGQTFAMSVPTAPLTIMQSIPPVVRTIYGVGGEMTTTFLFPGGYEADAASDAKLPDNCHVESISLGQAVLTGKDGNRMPVGFSSVTLTQAAPSVQDASVPPALPGVVPQLFIQQAPPRQTFRLPRLCSPPW